MKAKITLPNGAVVEVDASSEEIRRLAGEPGYRLELLPMVPPPICSCGRAYFSVNPPVCPVHGPPARVTVGPFNPFTRIYGWQANAAANPMLPTWIGSIGGSA